MRYRSLLTLALVAATALCACHDEPPPEAPRELPPTARSEIVAQFEADRLAERHPSDGGGSVELVEAPAELHAGQAARFRFRYTAGEQGIAVGGAVLFLAPPFWGWSDPQTRDSRAPGFCTVSTDAAGVLLSARQADRSLLSIEIGGRPLEAGESLELVYGAGDAEAQVDIYAEHDSTFWFRVDGDGDGVAHLIEDPPRVDIVAGPATRIVATLTSTAHPGGSARVTIAALDEFGNKTREPRSFQLRSEPEGLFEPFTLDALGNGDEFELEALAAGTWRVIASAALDGREVSTRSNPLWVRDDATPIRWADLHGHSGLSDGTGTPDDFFAYARDVAALDVVALTDHDHWGVRRLDEEPELWNGIAGSVARFHEPGRFVALHAYEWTNWIHGHRHVLHFEPEGPIFSSLDERTDTPPELWEALSGMNALTFAHHSAGGPIATNWDFAPDPVLEPLTEVMSVHGSSEAADSPQRIYAALSGNFVRDQLVRGYRLGFVGSGDGHDGHPGLSHLDPRSGWRRSPGGTERVGRGGIAAVRCDELTRLGVLEALRARDVYATSGPRILLETRIGDAVNPVRIASKALDDSSEYGLEVSGTAPIARVVVVRGIAGDSGTAVETDVVDLRRQGAPLDARISSRVGTLPPGSWVYARVEQEDGALAWSSPVFVE
ncbi:MAG: DUF3604 domain-containing protein [Planctomycetes bacterium]|nr:DUF3604 domain-containing protein [Planctomycetota bacterium]MCB9903166.1 DUF3604 domain-containing protein [Planctomycetota bacterium]